MNPKKLRKIIRAARGEIPADLVFKNGKVANVFSFEIQETDVAVCEDIIVGLGSYEGIETIDCRTRFFCPGFVGLGLVQGFGLSQGAMASSVAHDSHNIVVIGREPDDMVLAVKTIKEMKGGLVVVVQGKVQAKFPLPIAGLMSDQPIEWVIHRQEALLKAVPLTGCILRNPFMALSFLALPVIPELKITDKGLVDVN